MPAPSGPAPGHALVEGEQAQHLQHPRSSLEAITD